VSKRVSWGTALLALGIVNAVLADSVIVDAVAEEMATPPSQFIATAVPYLAWSGFYVGINGGYGWGNAHVDYGANDPAAQAGTCGGGGSPRGQCVPSTDFHRDGALAGGQVGFNWQVNPLWLVGLEADYQWSDFHGTGTAAFRLGAVGAAAMTASQSITSFGTIRARIGAMPIESLLLYGTGGFAFGQSSATLNLTSAATGGISSGGFSYGCPGGGASCFAGSASKTLLGWTAGAGAEYAVTGNLTFRTELLYVHLQSMSATATASSGAAPASLTANFVPAYFAVLRAGLNYRFH
jgi:outer membrane immunogenic protein